ncbi:MAG: hypothetical protein H6R07_2108 [Proteobacteria bacterium]|nr:hypothetical protein [Pseudomonadota bacterium]
MEIAPSFLAKEIFRILFLPPGVFVLLLILGLACWRRVAGRLLVLLSAALLYTLATPLAAGWLMLQVETPPPGSITLDTIDAIVCLGGGKRFGAYDMPGGETINNVTLARLRLAARLQRQSSKPVLVSGGAPVGGIPEANLMRDALEQDFRIPVRWVENRSNDTRDNAIMSATLLLPSARHILLVTSANHMPRAQRAFETAGFKVTSAPTDYANRETLNMRSFLPQPSAFHTSSTALYELVGSAWYRLRE